MKRLVCIILTLILAMQIGFTAVAVQANASYDTDELSKAAYVLNDLEIMSLQEETEIWQDKSVSRAEFAEMLCKAFKLETASDKMYFIDVPYDMWAFSSVTAMAEMGYISVPEDRKIRPYDTVTYAEALKMVLSAANYNIYAEYNGGFPHGYIKAANYLKIRVSAETDEALTTAAAVILIYDVMSMGFYYPEAYSDTNAVSYRESDEIIFSILWNTYIERGELQAYYGAGYNAEVREKDEVIVDGVEYKLDHEIYLNDYFLSEVEFIYKKPSDDEAGIIIFMEDVGNDNELLINSDDIIGFESGSYTLSYFKGDKSMRKSLQRGASVVYNGAAYSGSVEEIIEEFTSGGKRGTIRIKEAQDKEIVIIKSYRDYVAGYAESATSRLFNQFDSADCIDMTEYKQTSVKSLEGTETTLDYSTLPMLLSVAESKDKSALEIVVCRDKVSGSIEEVSGKGSDMYFTIGGTKYELDALMYKNQMLDENGVEISASSLLGTEYDFYIDSFGNIAYMKALGAGNGFSLGYIIDGVVNDNGFSSEIRLKILTENQGIIEYSVKDKVVIDGISHKLDNKESVLEAIRRGEQVSSSTAEDGHLAQQVIRYKADENNIIWEIDTAYLEEEENEDNTLTLVAGDGKTAYAYKVTGGMPKFGQKILFSLADTKVFTRPITNSSGEVIVKSDAAGDLTGNIIIRRTTSGYSVDTKVLDKSGNPLTLDDTMYKMGIVGSLTSDYPYTIRAYKYNPVTPYCDVLVYSYEPYSVPIENVMVEEFTEVMGDNGEITKMLTGWGRGTKVNYEIADNSDVSDIECGDIVYLWKDTTGKKIAFVTKIYDYSDDKFVNRPFKEEYYADYIWAVNKGSTDSPYYYGYNELAKGLVLSKVGSTMEWDWDGNYRTFEQTFDFTNIPIVIYDKELTKNKVYVGSVAEVPDYKSVGEENAARIVINTDRLRGVCAFIYLNY